MNQRILALFNVAVKLSRRAKTHLPALRKLFNDGVKVIPIHFLDALIYRHQRAKSSITSTVSEELSCICGAEEDASTWNILNVSTVSSSESIITQAEDLFNASSIGFSESVKFTDFDEPNAL